VKRGIKVNNIKKNCIGSNERLPCGNFLMRCFRKLSCFIKYGDIFYFIYNKNKGYFTKKSLLNLYFFATWQSLLNPYFFLNGPCFINNKDKDKDKDKD
jgi:hypothetical protein